MNPDTDWLEQVLLNERRDVQVFLEGQHKVLIASLAGKQRRVTENLLSMRADASEMQELVEAPTQSLKDLGNPEDNPSALGVEYAPSLDSEMVTAPKAECVSALLRAFDEIDRDRDGKIRLDEFREALRTVGQNPAFARKMIKQVETLCKGNDCLLTGEITRTDWMHLVCGEKRMQLDRAIWELAESLMEHAAEQAAHLKTRRFYFMLSSLSPTRLVWDCLCALCTLYVVTIVPLWLGFGMDILFSDPAAVDAFSWVDHFVDVVFIFDIALNFRTGYIEKGGNEELRWQTVASHYLRTWFLFDMCSSLPVSFFSVETNGDVRTVKLTKFTRFFTIMKIMRAAKVFQFFEETRLGEYLGELIIDYKLQYKVMILEIVVCLCACCHWLACGMAACGLEFIASFIDGSPVFSEVYNPAFYWAVTTCTTVGYGDITPKNNSERVVAMIAMCVGGTFYGIISATFTSIIASADRVGQARSAKMGVVNSWLQRHKLPTALRRRVRYYFKSLGRKEENFTRDELAIISELTTQLQAEVSMVLVPEEVRFIPIFECMPSFVIGFLISIMHVVTFRANEVIVRAGDCGASMYIVKSGHCEKETSKDPNQFGDSCVTKLQLFAGESFGEEVILGLAEEHKHTVRAIKKSELHRITRSLFQVGIALYPEHLETMRACWKSTAGSESPFPSSRSSLHRDS